MREQLRDLIVMSNAYCQIFGLFKVKLPLVFILEN